MITTTGIDEVITAIKDAGGSPKFVGGMVRDQIMGVLPKDFDIEVSLLEPSRLAEVLAKFGEVNIVGATFGIFKVNGLDADFSVPRKENKIGKGHKDFEVILDPFMTVKERAKRRDLTMNSMELDPFTQKIEDPFNGQADIKNNILRATDPKTFVEDDLRAVRVAQFISRFPQMEPNEELIQLCSQADLSNITGERLWEEFKKLLLKGKRPDMGMEFLEESGLLKFFPELDAIVGCEQHPIFHAEGDVFTHTKMVLLEMVKQRSGVEERDSILMLAALCHDLGKPSTTEWDEEKKRLVSNGHDVAGVKPTESFLRRINTPAKVIESVVILVHHHLKPFTFIQDGAGPSAYRRLARKMVGVPLEWLGKLANSDSYGRECSDMNHQTKEDVEEFLRLAKEVGVNDLKKGPEDVVKGRHLLARGFKQGPEIGKILQQCRDLQDESGEKDSDKILEVILKETK